MAAERLPWLDGWRGLALLAMAIYHLVWDLAFFGFAPADVVRSRLFVYAGHTIASAFLAIAGLALALAATPHFNASHFMRRLATIIAAAALVSLFTWIAFPQSFVAFGILHCIAAASMICLVFLRAPFWLTALAGIAICLAGSMIHWPRLDVVNGWLGLGARIPLTQDWRPIFPWAGVMLIGLAVGQYGLPRGLLSHGGWRPPAALIWAGRRSLLIYLAHQPLLFGLIWLAASAMSPAPQDEAPRAAYLAACVDGCKRQAGGPESCARTCACIAEGIGKAQLWTSIARERLEPEEQPLYAAILDRCLGAARP